MINIIYMNDFSESRQGKTAGCCQFGYERSSSLKAGNLPARCQPVKKLFIKKYGSKQLILTEREASYEVYTSVVILSHLPPLASLSPQK